MIARSRVVIIGGGFGGIAAAQALRGGNVDVLVIDRHNHFVFQPLLYQVASGLLAPSDIAVPIRWYLRKQQNTSVVLGEVTAIDVEQRTVSINGGEIVEPYDFLVVASGSRHAYFGHDAWEQDAPGLKSLDDALHMRSRFLTAFEQAELSNDPGERQAWQTIVIVGGGPTGAELAGIMVTIARKALRSEFRRIDTAATRILLVEGGNRILPTFPEELSARALEDLKAMGVEVLLNSMVSQVDAGSVRIGDGDVIRTHTVFWAAGNAASPLSRQLGAPLDRAGRVLVEPDLSLPGHPEVFVVGDMAVTTQRDGRPVPGVAQGGIQGGRTAGRNILRTLRRQERRPFRYLNKGDMATLGRHSAVADLGFVRFGGPLAWFIWLFIHIAYLAGFRNRLIVLVEWAWEYFTYQRGVRLILGRDRLAVPDPSPSVRGAAASIGETRSGTP